MYSVLGAMVGGPAESNAHASVERVFGFQTTRIEEEQREISMQQFHGILKR